MPVSRKSLETLLTRLELSLKDCASGGVDLNYRAAFAALTADVCDELQPLAQLIGPNGCLHRLRADQSAVVERYLSPFLPADLRETPIEVAADFLTTFDPWVRLGRVPHHLAGFCSGLEGSLAPDHPRRRIAQAFRLRWRRSVAYVQAQETLPEVEQFDTACERLGAGVSLTAEDLWALRIGAVVSDVVEFHAEAPEAFLLYPPPESRIEWIARTEALARQLDISPRELLTACPFRVGLDVPTFHHIRRLSTDDLVGLLDLIATGVTEGPLLEAADCRPGSDSYPYF
jgi:hypothetical protein